MAKRYSPKAKLCRRGVEAAKRKYDIYPSAYANAYAAKVCQGKAADARGRRRADRRYVASLRQRPSSALRRWFAERWVNVCEPPPFPACGRRSGSLKPRDYPYCRPLRRVSKATPKTVGEMSRRELAAMCAKKERRMRSHRGRSPSRVYVKRRTTKQRGKKVGRR